MLLTELRICSEDTETKTFTCRELTVEENDILSTGTGVFDHQVSRKITSIYLHVFFYHQLADSEMSTSQEEGGRKRRWTDYGGEKGRHQPCRWESTQAWGGDKGGR